MQHDATITAENMSADCTSGSEYILWSAGFQRRGGDREQWPHFELFGLRGLTTSGFRTGRTQFLSSFAPTGTGGVDMSDTTRETENGVFGDNGSKTELHLGRHLRCCCARLRQGVQREQYQVSRMSDHHCDTICNSRGFDYNSDTAGDAKTSALGSNLISRSSLLVIHR